MAGLVIPASEGALGGDAWVAKLNADGGVEWSETYGGSGYDVARSIIEVAGGGYLFVEGTSSDDGNVEGHLGGGDYWVVRLDEGGSILWQRCLGGTDTDLAFDVVQTSDLGYVITGDAGSSDGDVTDSNGHTDMWVIKLGENGDLLWKNALGGSSGDVGYAVVETLDGGLVSTGYTTSDNGDVVGFNGLYDYWVVKLTSQGEFLWQLSLGGTDQDIAGAICENPDNGTLAVIGSSYSTDGQVTDPRGGLDAWMVIISPTGDLLSTRSCGGSAADSGGAILPYADGWLIAGSSASTNGDLEANNGATDTWLFRSNLAGDLIWSTNYGGNRSDGGFTMTISGDGGILLGGTTLSTNFAQPVSGGYDLYVMKLEPDDVGIVESGDAESIRLSPNPATSIVFLDYSTSKKADVEVRTISGQLLSRTTLNGIRTQLDVGELSSGTYIVHVRSELGPHRCLVFVKH